MLLGIIYNNGCYGLQWNLRIKDTLGPTTLSFVKLRGCPLLGGSNCISTVERELFGARNSVLCREVCPLLECPLSEVPLYMQNHHMRLN